MVVNSLGMKNIVHIKFKVFSIFFSILYSFSESTNIDLWFKKKITSMGYNFIFRARNWFTSYD